MRNVIESAHRIPPLSQVSPLLLLFLPMHTMLPQLRNTLLRAARVSRESQRPEPGSQMGRNERPRFVRFLFSSFSHNPASGARHGTLLDRNALLIFISSLQARQELLSARLLLYRCEI